MFLIFFLLALQYYLLNENKGEYTRNVSHNILYDIFVLLIKS